MERDEVKGDVLFILPHRTTARPTSVASSAFVRELLKSSIVFSLPPFAVVTK